MAEYCPCLIVDVYIVTVSLFHAFSSNPVSFLADVCGHSLPLWEWQNRPVVGRI